MGLRVRAVEGHDKQRWLTLWQGYLTFYKTSLTSEQTELTWARFFDASFNTFACVAELEGEVVGITHYSFQSSTWSDQGYCYLEDLFVNPGQRGAGIGRQLIEAVKEIAIVQGCTRLYWNTDADNATARSLYDTFVAESGKVQYRISLTANDL